MAVIRISGPSAGQALLHLGAGRPEPRVARLVTLRDLASGTALDRALVLWFPGPASFTGEDCAELQIHGGRAVIEAVLGSLAAMPGCRMAHPGEFTRRAFIGGKMDLAEVEGLADLIDAQTEAQRRQALRQLEGGLGAWVAEQRATLLRALAAAESAIDFSDEADVTGAFDVEIRHLVAHLHGEVNGQLARAATGARVREGLVVTLAGPPNAGKSTLLNALSRREAAIVSPHAGTTRDPVEVDLDLHGCLVRCIDTAGLRDTADPVERQGIERARARAGSSDLVLWLFDARVLCEIDPDLKASLLWTVATKVDLADGPPPPADFIVSAPHGTGMTPLVEAIATLAGNNSSEAGTGLITRQRHRAALQSAADALRALQAAHGAADIEVVAEQLRFVARCLDSLIGRIAPDEILGEIFARFCIGK